MKRIFNFFFLVCIACMFPSAIFATDYYVDPAGSDANNGQSTGSPWQTLAKVSSTVFSPGDRILLKAGSIWAGQLQPQGSGSAAAPIIIDRYGSGVDPRINGNGTNLSCGVYLLNVSYWEINNLEISNQQTAGGTARLFGIKLENTGPAASMLNHLHVMDCYVHHVNAVGTGQTNYVKNTGGIIAEGNISDLLIRSCHISDVTMEGIRTNSPSRCTEIVIDSNLVENVSGDGIVIHGAKDNCRIMHNVVRNVCTTPEGAFAGIWTYDSYKTRIAFNEVYNIPSSTGGDRQPFDADIDTDGDVFEYNYSHNNEGGFMLFMPNAQNIVVRFNISVNDAKRGTRLLDLRPTNTSNKIYNNVFYVPNKQTNLFSAGFSGTFSNNIIFCGVSPTKFSNSALSGSSVFRNNCFYPASMTNTNGPAGTVNGNISSNPGFVTPGYSGTGFAGAAAAYQLPAVSACLDGGVVIPGNGGLDFAQNMLPSGNPDIGALQHSGPVAFRTANTADAYVRNGTYANTNFGTETLLNVKADAVSYKRNAYLKFDMTGFNNAQAGTAVLQVFADQTGLDPSRTISAYTSATESWTESGITWNNAPADLTAISDFAVTTPGTWYTIDVTAAVNQQLQQPDKMISFVLRNNGGNASNGLVHFSSREMKFNAPRLLIYDGNAPLARTIAAVANTRLPEQETMKVKKAKVFPNPVTGSCVVESRLPMHSVSVYNLQGKLLHTVNNLKSLQHTLSTEGWGKGICIIKITGADWNEELRILKTE